MKKLHNKKRVYVVHCVDTEGPLYESLEATFERLHSLLGVKIPPSVETLKKIQNKELDLHGKEKIAAEIFSPHLINYNDTWEKIDKMLLKIMSPEFRNQLKDSIGGGWIFNWHCVDHVGYVTNPRHREMGYHKIFDHYQDMIQRTDSSKDAIHWHFHPLSIYREGNQRGTSFFNSPHLHELLCRKIIERQWFPRVFRAGFHVERPDINLFLEQWIPFDISNVSNKTRNMEEQSDLQDGRFGDWRFAPDDWSIYHPSHDNYQLPGNCRRSIGRILNLFTRHDNITQTEVDKAFERAAKGLPTVLGITNHDFRNMEYEINRFRNMLSKSTEKFPDVEFVYSEAVHAFRNVLYGNDQEHEKLSLDVSVKENIDNLKIKVKTIRGKVFGPQPYLAIKTKSGQFVHENFDLISSNKEWAYTFDNESIKPTDVSIIGVASNDKYANTFVKLINLSN